MKSKVLKFSEFTNNDLQKIYLFTGSDQFSFSHIDHLVKSVGGLVFEYLLPPGVFANNINIEMPCYNYGNFKEISEFIKVKAILPENIYNLPQNLKYANDKVEFFKKVESFSFIPKTVFKLEEAKKLKFPIICKPKDGSKGIGIEVFKTKEELESSENKFDVYSEKFNLKREFRVISVCGNMVFIAERIPMNEHADALRESEDIFDRESSLDSRSSYKWEVVKFGKDGIPSEDKFKAICKKTNEALELEILGVDIAIDDNNKLWLIEANTCPGLNKDQVLLIYEAIFEDFYGRKIQGYGKDQLESYREQLLNASSSDIKFAFSGRPYKKVDLSYGAEEGKKQVSVKFDLEKSFGDSLKNLKKKYNKE